MSVNKQQILTIFNDHFMELLEDIIRIFPNDVDLLTIKNSFSLIRKSNPKLIITSFQKNVVIKYEKQIHNGDIHFFIEKDYNEDVNNEINSDKIIEAINRLREPIRRLDDKNKLNTIKYLQNLCKLSCSYHNL